MLDRVQLIGSPSVVVNGYSNSEDGERKLGCEDFGDEMKKLIELSPGGYVVRDGRDEM